MRMLCDAVFKKDIIPLSNPTIRVSLVSSLIFQLSDAIKITSNRLTNNIIYAIKQYTNNTGN